MAEEEADNLIAQIDSTIGSNLQLLRERFGLSQAELARLATESGVRGFHQTTIARIEGGSRSLRAAEAIALARILETSLEYLAESEDTVRLRRLSEMLREDRKKFDEALRQLMLSRWHVAWELDSWLPYGPDGIAPVSEVLKANVNFDLYEMVEDMLVNSDPIERTDNILLQELHRLQRVAEASGSKVEVKQRVQYMIEALSDHFADSEDNGEHPEAP